MKRSSGFLICLLLLCLAIGPLTAAAIDATGATGADAAGPAGPVDANTAGAAIAAQWSLQALLQFMASHASDDLQRSADQVGVPMPLVMVINGYGALVAVSSPDLLSVQDLRRTPAEQGEALAAMLAQVIDGQALAGKLDPRRPTVVLVTIDSDECQACAAAPRQVQRVIAREGRPWNFVHATATARQQLASPCTKADVRTVEHRLVTLRQEIDDPVVRLAQNGVIISIGRQAVEEALALRRQELDGQFDPPGSLLLSRAPELLLELFARSDAAIDAADLERTFPVDETSPQHQRLHVLAAVEYRLLVTDSLVSGTAMVHRNGAPVPEADVHWYAADDERGTVSGIHVGSDGWTFHDYCFITLA